MSGNNLGYIFTYGYGSATPVIAIADAVAALVVSICSIRVDFSAVYGDVAATPVGTAANC